MQVNNINSQNFNGYKNIISNHIVTPSNLRFTFLSMQLDNVKHNDLEIWHNIQRNFLKVDRPSDIITVQAMKDNVTPALYLADKPINPRNFKQSSKNEALVLKAYTMLASLSKRIMNDNHLIKDTGIAAVFTKTIERLNRFFGNDISLTNLVVMSELDTENHPQANSAALFNVINDIMKDYFKD